MIDIPKARIPLEVIDAENVTVIEHPLAKGKGSTNKTNNKFTEQTPRIGQFEPGDMASAAACVNWKSNPCTDPEELIVKFDEYFKRCMQYGVRPTVEGLSITAGVCRNTLYDWERGAKRSGSGLSDVVKKAKQYVNYVLATMASTGKVQPVFFIFYAKNHFGYVDKVEHEVTSSTPLTEIETGPDLQKRIEASIVIDEDNIVNDEVGE